MNKRVWLVILALIASEFTIFMPRAFASSLTMTDIQELGGASFANPMIASDGQQILLHFKTVGAGATTASIVFDSSFTTAGGSVVSGSAGLNSTGCASYFPGTVTPLPGSPTATGNGTNTISISSISPALSATTEYCTILTNTAAVTNASAGVYTATVTVGSDSQTAAFDVLASGDNDYNVTGTVLPTFTMSLSPNTTDPVGNLSSTALSLSTGVTVTVNTNAASGWNLYAMDSQAGMHSTSAGHTISSVAGGSNQTMNGGTIGTEAYALGVSANATTNYAYNAGTTGGALSNTAFNRIATSGSPASNVTQVLHELVDISGTTPAATDYTDTITVIGSGQF